jgi:hypothetical protein
MDLLMRKFVWQCALANQKSEKRFPHTKRKEKKTKQKTYVKKTKQKKTKNKKKNT